MKKADRETSRILVDEEFVAVQPSLVRALEGNVMDALVLQYLHFWLRASSNVHEGEVWVYNTYQDWADRLGISPKQAERSIRRLEERGIVVSCKPDSGDWNHRKWYRIDPSRLREIDLPISGDRSPDSGDSSLYSESTYRECSDPSDQNLSSPSVTREDRDEETMDEPDALEGSGSGAEPQVAAPLSPQGGITEPVAQALAITQERYGKGSTTSMLTSRTKGQPPGDAPWCVRLDADEIVTIVDLCHQFSTRSHEVGGNRYLNPFTQGAAKSIKRLIHVDGFSADNVRVMIDWVTRDEFWSPNVRTHSALSDKWDQLRGARNRKVGERKKREQDERIGGTTEAWMSRSTHGGGHTDGV